MLLDVESMGNVSEPGHTAEYFLAILTDTKNTNTIPIVSHDIHEFVKSIREWAGRGFCVFRFNPCRSIPVSPNLKVLERLTEQYSAWDADDYRDYVQDRVSSYLAYFQKIPPEWKCLGERNDLNADLPMCVKIWMEDKEEEQVLQWDGKGDFRSRYPLDRKTEHKGSRSMAPASSDRALYALLPTTKIPDLGIEKPVCAVRVDSRFLEYSLLDRLPMWFFHVADDENFEDLKKEIADKLETVVRHEKTEPINHENTKRQLLEMFGG